MFFREDTMKYLFRWFFPVLFLFLFSHSSQAQEQSPGRDLSPWIKSWKTSPSLFSHGTIVERAIFTPGDPLNPPEQGAVLKYISKFSRGVLAGSTSTRPIAHEGENEVIFIVKGHGRIKAGGKVEALIPMDSVLIPPGLEHTIINESDSPLEILIVTEPVPDDFEPRKDILVVNAFGDSRSWYAHWCMTGHTMLHRNQGLCQLESAAVVMITGKNMAEPHRHIEGHEEIWYQLEGSSHFLLGTQLYEQPEGTAFLIPPDGETPHASINVTEEPMLWFFLARWNDR